MGLRSPDGLEAPQGSETGICNRGLHAQDDGSREMKKIILADPQGIFRTGAAKIMAGMSDLRIITQCAEVDRLLLLK